LPFAGSHDPDQPDKEVLSRIVPAVMYFFADAAAAVHQAVQSARITNQAPVALDCARVLAAMLHQALAGRDKLSILRPDEALLATATLKPVVRAILEGSYARKAPPAITGGGTVTEALEAALWAFHTSRDLRSGMLQVVNLGEDSDVAAAIYGQLAGAFYGVTAIPGNWRNSLIRKDLIEETSDRLLTHAMVALAD
ncbi:MAG TPA: ADP-ribosylglycohydrolase family protein, partial [Steroidobacteraceae bacterium]|nr:ADP-ribosylglycohydrolase family protein [Steroidobacteraceae bacterium]